MYRWIIQQGILQTYLFIGRRLQAMQAGEWLPNYTFCGQFLHESNLPNYGGR